MSDPNRTVPVQIDQLRQMERQLAEHARRAALVAEWAEGLRAGRAYGTGGESGWLAAAYPDWVLVGELSFEVDSRTGVDHGCRDSDPARAAAYMLSISDQWQEVEP